MKLNKNGSKGSGDMVRTRNSRVNVVVVVVNPMTLNCDLDLESV